jgi:hypothetical protein
MTDVAPDTVRTPWPDSWVAPCLIVVAFLAANGVLMVLLAEGPGGPVTRAIIAGRPWLTTAAYLALLGIGSNGLAQLVYSVDERLRFHGRRRVALAVIGGLLILLISSAAATLAVPVDPRASRTAEIALLAGLPIAVTAGLASGATTARRYGVGLAIASRRDPLQEHPSDGPRRR